MALAYGLLVAMARRPTRKRLRSCQKRRDALEVTMRRLAAKRKKRAAA